MTKSEFTVHVAEAERAAPCKAAQTVLDACLAAGIAFPYNCRSGECGECQARLLRGQVRESPGADPAIFNDSHRGRGLILACLCYPESDLALAVPLRTDQPPVIAEFDGLVEAVEALTPTIIGVTLRAEQPIDYRAGQYFQWLLPGVAPDRAFSAANFPGGDLIEFHLRRYPGGKVADSIDAGRIAPGGFVALRGPYGMMRLGQDDARPAIMVAGGTGMAPILALLDEAFAKNCRRPITYFYGARNRDELYKLDTLANWHQRHKNFDFVPVLSDEAASSNWPGARGLVTDILARKLIDGFGAEAYLCGPSLMIDAALPILIQAGVDRTDIHFDKFAPAVRAVA